MKVEFFPLNLTASLAEWLRNPLQEWKIPDSNPACAGIVSGSSHTSDFKIGTPVATLPCAWRYRVSAGTGWPSVSILWLGVPAEMKSLVCNFYLSVAAYKIVPETHLHVAGTLSNQPINKPWISILWSKASTSQQVVKNCHNMSSEVFDFP